MMFLSGSEQWKTYQSVGDLFSNIMATHKMLDGKVIRPSKHYFP
jgi:hypothetical protein